MELGLIGYPVQHSKSPWIHQHFLSETNLTGNYQLIEIHPDQFDEEIMKLKASNLSGFNVTIPYKEKIIPYLDEISPAAQKIGAVNTVVCRNNRWYGDNTDGRGLVTALKEQFPELFTGDKSVLILGAGGASRGIYYALLNEEFEEIVIANRTVIRAQALIDANPSGISSAAISFSEAEAKLNQFDLVIQTTSVGMTPHIEEQVIDLSRLKPGAVVSDIVYQPFWTKLLRDAKARGGRVHHGHEMLIYQAKLAFEMWSGKQVNAKLLKDKLKHDLLS